MKHIRYNRADIRSTLSVARKIAETKTCYVYATAYGFAIEYAPAPFGQQYYKVTSDAVELLGGIKH